MRLTDTQLMLLSAAAKRNDGALAIPAKKSSAEAHKLLKPLLARKLVEQASLSPDAPKWPSANNEATAKAFRITTAGLQAIGVEPESADAKPATKAQRSAPHRTEDAKTLATSPKSTASSKPKPKASTRSKQHIVLDLLRRKDGASIAAMTNATGWQAHSIRGFLSGTVKKKLGLKVDSSKSGDERVYRIVESRKPSNRKAS